jgi:DNA-binding Xre family transcriptional regulator
MELNIEKIDKEIKRLRFTHKILSEKMGKSRSTITTILRSKNNNHTFKTVECFAKALDLDPKDILIYTILGHKI